MLVLFFCIFGSFKTRICFYKFLKNWTFCKVDLATLFRVRLNNRVLFHNKWYCGVDKKAVILHPIKNALF